MVITGVAHIYELVVCGRCAALLGMQELLVHLLVSASAPNDIGFTEP